MNRPLVSICIPTFNRVDLLGQSLASIRAQTYSPLEILISDNGSADGTESLCRTIQQTDPRVRYYRHPTNIGLYPNHNFCITESRGPLLCFFHDDDLYAPSIVADYVAFLERHPDVGLVCADWELIDDAGVPLGSRRFTGPDVTPGFAYISRTIRTGRSSLNCPGTMIRRSALGEVRFDDAGPIGFGDFVVWFQMAERTAVGHVPRVLWRYRIHQRSLSRRTIVGMARDFQIALGRYCDVHLARWPAHRRLVDEWRSSMARFLFWALVYEIGRHHRRADAGRLTQTIFDVMGYTLSAQEFDDALSLLRLHERGLLKPLVRRAIERIVRSGHVQPLSWVTAWAPRLRGLGPR